MPIYTATDFGITLVHDRLIARIPATQAHSLSIYFYALSPELRTSRTSSAVVPLYQKQNLHPASAQSPDIWEGSWLWEPPVGFEIAYLLRLERKSAVSAHEHHWLLDPFASISWGGEIWGQPKRFQVSEVDGRLFIKDLGTQFQSSSAGVRRLALLNQSPPMKHTLTKIQPTQDLGSAVVYEAHVRGMTQHPSSGVTESERGTFAGLRHKLPYLKELGVTVLELLPIFDFDENENPAHNPETGERLKNYWGYSPLLWMAPKAAYAEHPQQVSNEFQALVNDCHGHGLEVWLDVVFNHSAELDAAGPVDHFKVLDPEGWYIHALNQQLFNASGCGNTLRCAHPVVKQLLLQSLLHWHEQFGVDGFRFDLTSILNRHPDHGEFLEFPNLLWELRQHPRLKNVHLVAEPWDAWGYQLGHYAYHARWTEWNDQYRDGMRRVLRGDTGQAETFREAITGFPSIFGNQSSPPWPSLNFLSSHDGFPLWDLFSYEQKHNEANGEMNRDGHSNNYSSNHGLEGSTSDPQILALRERKWRMAWTLLAVSRGPMMVTAGDEWGRSQGGNNNAYCQDNEITWLNWHQAEVHPERLEFVRQLLQLRKHWSAEWWSGQTTLEWRNSAGGEPDWQPHVRSFVWQLKPQSQDHRWWFLCNAYDAPLPFVTEAQQPITWIWNSSQESLTVTSTTNIQQEIPAYAVVIGYEGSIP